MVEEMKQTLNVENSNPIEKESPGEESSENESATEISSNANKGENNITETGDENEEMDLTLHVENATSLEQERSSPQESLENENILEDGNVSDSERNQSEGDDDASNATDVPDDGKKLDGEDTASKKSTSVAERSETNISEMSEDKHATSGINGNASPANADSQSKDGQTGLINMPPPSWPDVTFDQLVDYPKKSLLAEAYFDMQQIRAIKPVTLLAMGISVPKFPDLEKDSIISFAVKKTKYQLYHPADVLPKRPSSKSYLLKEIMRRAILRNLKGSPDTVTHSHVRKNKRNGTSLPRPSNYTTVQCINWLKSNPLSTKERSYVLKCVKQWWEQVRDQISKVEPKTKEIEEALAQSNFKEWVEGGWEEEGEEGATQPHSVNDGTAAGNMVHNNDFRNPRVAFETFTNQLLANSVINDFNSRMRMMPTQTEMTYQNQLTTAINMNHVQAQAIDQYHRQIAALQEQVKSLANKTQFEIFVSKDTFKFNASHFVAYPGFRERLHGHNYRASVKLIGSHQIGGDGYVLDFGCVKSVTKDVCKKLNEYFLVPMLSDVLTIDVEEEEDQADGLDGVLTPGGSAKKSGRKKKRKRKYGPSVTITSEDGSVFVFPRQDCLLMPIMHSTAEELAVYIYGKILAGLDSQYLLKRGVTTMEVTVSEAVGQDAIFRNAIPTSGGAEFDIASYISKEAIPMMPCATDTEGAKIRKQNS